MGRSTKLILIINFLCVLVNLSRECGPGTSVSRRKILKPMVLYQRLPDADEESIRGSGMFRRIVTEGSKEYKELVRNYNKDIVFERGDGKRIMTKRCREKINKLATLVKHEWPNVKLRVIEAYDKYGQHPPNSLHYEARAVDITTSDRDKSKIGNLGSLAFQAGFDWVYYESNSYIHASVIAENEVSLKQAECFPGSAKIHSLEHGEVELKNLKVGDQVLTYKNMNGNLKEFYTPVLGFLDNVPEIKQPYLVFKTEDGISFATTKSHLIYTVRRESSTYSKRFGMRKKGSKPSAQGNLDMLRKSIAYKYETIMAYSVIGHSSETLDKLEISVPMSTETSPENIVNVQPAFSLVVGNEVIISNNGSSYASKITKITVETRQGAFAPLTEEGNLIVNNVLSSCYAKIDDANLAHHAFLPYRYIAILLPVNIKQYCLSLYIAVLRTINGLFNIVALN